MVNLLLFAQLMAGAQLVDANLAVLEQGLIKTLQIPNKPVIQQQPIFRFGLFQYKHRRYQN